MNSPFSASSIVSRMSARNPFELSEEFYKQVQLDCADWIKIGTTKTAMVYGLGDSRVKNQE